MKNILLFLSITTVVYSAKSALPKCFTHHDINSALEFAKKEHRPLLVYVHSSHCYDSKKFTREIMSSVEIVNVLKNQYNCLDAEISSSNGNSIAKKYNVYKLPSIILIDPNSDLQFELPMKKEPQYLIDHFNYFLSSCSIAEQITFFLTTSNITKAEASKKVAVSYVRRDKKISAGASPQYYIYAYTLNQTQFSDFESAYIEEWQKSLKLEDDKKVAAVKKLN
ncbi:MAG: thioredoxin family protein [Bacteroidota bacterium]|nr:thioredoxin family protein [Bacteroidota bacterium]